MNSYQVYFKLRIDNLNYKNIFCYWSIFLGVLALIYINCELYIPPAFKYKKLTSQMINNHNYNNTYFKLEKEINFKANIENLERHNNFLLLGWKKRKINKDNLIKNNIENSKKLKNYIWQKNYFIDYKMRIFNKNKKINKISQKKLAFNPLKNIIYFPYFYNNYHNDVNIEVNLKFDELKDELLDFEYDFFLETNNNKFLNYITFLKIKLWILSIIFFIYFKKNWKKIPVKYILFEQKIISKIGFILILYNNPFYLYNYKIGSYLILVLRSSIINALYSFIIYKWLTIFNQIDYFTRKKTQNSNNFNYKILILSQFILGNFRVIMNSYIFLNDPIKILKKNYVIYYDLIFYIYLFLNLFIFLLILKHLFFINLNKDNLLLRQKIYIIMSLYFMIIISLCILISYFDRKYKFIFLWWRKRRFNIMSYQLLCYYFRISIWNK